MLPRHCHFSFFVVTKMNSADRGAGVASPNAASLLEGTNVTVCLCPCHDISEETISKDIVEKDSEETVFEQEQNSERTISEKDLGCENFQLEVMP